MVRPFSKDLSDMSFADRNHEIQTLAACTTDQPLTKRIRLGRSVWRSQYPQAEGSK
jgi:hypothetical protein